MTRIRTSLALLACAFLLVQGVRADDRDKTACTVQSTTVLENLDGQLAAALKSNKEDVRTKAMGSIAHFARNCGDKIQFEKVVPVLLDRYESAKDGGERKAAFTALQAISNSYGIERLRELASPGQSERRQNTLEELKKSYNS